MARKLRVEYPGAIYHIMSRGDRREAIFNDDQDRQRFWDTLSEACEKTGWQIHAGCLMSNHFHLVVETPLANLVTGMKWLLGTYTGRFNRRHREFGHLFSGRYKSLVVDGSGNGYLKTVCDYVHLNPARADIVKKDQLLRDFPWSTYPLYLQAAAQRPPWLRTDRLLGEWAIPKDSPAGRRVFARGMEARRREDLSIEFKPLERGWCVGDDDFRRELLEQMAAQLGLNHYGDEIQEAGETQAEKWLAGALKKMNWSENDLAAKRKGHKEKVRLAIELRTRTTMSLSWIAQRLKMGSRGYLTWLLQRHNQIKI